jgi:hypothetical protein
MKIKSFKTFENETYKGVSYKDSNKPKFTLSELKGAFNAARIMSDEEFHFEEFEDWYRSELQQIVDLTGRGYIYDDQKLPPEP